MKNKLYFLLISFSEYLKRIVSEELEIIDKFYYECTQRNNLIEEGEAHV